MEREKKNDKYPIIDDAKMFFCICIICLHTDGLSFLPAAKEKIIVQSIFRLAVPFFFVVSGFFYQRN